MPAVSVIVPVYNVAAYAGECLASLGAQTFSDFEVVMVDDGSTDSSGVICREWAEKDRRFRLIEQSNRGVSAARNAGMCVAKGDYITFVDSDDIVHPRYIEVLTDILKRKTYMVAGVGMVRFTDTIPPVGTEMHHFYHYLPSDALKSMLYQTGPVLMNAVWGKMFRREAVEGLTFREGILYEDLDWMARLLENMPRTGRVGIADLTFYFYRRRRGSQIQEFTKARLDVLGVTREIEARIVAAVTPRSGRGMLRAASDRRLSACFDIFMQLSAPGRGEYGEIRCECWREICRRRWRSLIDRHVRRKNKLGILLSLFGPEICGRIGSRLINRLKS